jgi:hypothetical protein
MKNYDETSDPSPEQIEERCKKIRESWSPEEKLWRSGKTFNGSFYSVPQYLVHSRYSCGPGKKGVHVFWKRV